MKVLVGLSPRERHLIKTYGITEEEYDGLLQAQGGGCAICNKTPSQEGKSLAVDHNHKTGEIRGVLCTYCNHRVVGRHTDADLLRRVADYLERDTGFKVPAPVRKKRRRKGAKNG